MFSLEGAFYGNNNTQNFGLKPNTAPSDACQDCQLAVEGLAITGDALFFEKQINRGVTFS